MRVIEPYFQIEGSFDPKTIMKTIEAAGRTCYKSEGKIGDGTAEKFIRSVIKRGHESVLEHEKITVRIICDRGITHEIVRHRIASYSQESSRYCVAGDMKIYFKNPHQKMNLRELYTNLQNSKNGAWKRLHIKQFNENTGELQYAKIKAVYHNGQKECLRISTKLGYQIECTLDHKIMTQTGYIEAQNLKKDDLIYVNGTNCLYKNKEWLYHQNITLNKTFTQISRDFGFNVSTLKKWARKFNLPKKGTGYFHIGHIPWNKGKGNASKTQVEALRKYHHCGRRKDKILKPDTSVYRKYKKNSCEICGTNSDLEVHHIDENRSNNYPENLLTACESCHLRIHSKNLKVAYGDKIVNIEKIGLKDVYDIEMDSEFHNFVANGVIVHNCNYTQDKFGNELTFIKPCFWDTDSENYKTWESAMALSESEYMLLLNNGATPEEARSVLPNSLKTEIVTTMNIREWRHFFKLRTSPAAHPQMREIANMMLKEFKAQLPVLFEDIEVQEV